MTRNPLPGRCRAAALTVAWVMVFSASAAVAQQPRQEDAAPPAATENQPPEKSPVLSGRGPLRLPAPSAPAKPALPVARPFAPSEQVRADADVAFPADI